MEEKNTRQIILREALGLFAEKGYAAVSMQDIASAASIRASSIYHYFGGKQELFDVLVQEANDVKSSLQTVFLLAFSKQEKVEEEGFVQAGIFFAHDYLQNPKIAPLLKALECERRHDEKADSAWRELMISAPLEHEAQIFRALCERGEIMDSDAEALAAEYQSMLLMAYITGDTDRLKTQLIRFYRRVFISESGKEERV